VKVLDFVAFGNMVIDWTLNRVPRPANMTALRAATAGVLDIPPEITGLIWTDVDLNTLVIKLPNKDRVNLSVEIFGDPANPSSYPLPAFYTDSTLTKLDILACRIADYTIAQCM
jgi:hypothetical protein